MKVLVTGAKGQLGHDVVKVLELNRNTAIGVDIEEMDITDYSSVYSVINKEAPEAVIHCAAYTAVDLAEENQDICMKVNVLGTDNIAKVCKSLDIKMMYISTDYVFNGQGVEPWNPNDKREPINIYGQSKYKGEISVEQNLIKFFIVRISWVFGINGNNFVTTMLKLGRSKNCIKIIDDQIGSPTYTYDLAKLLAKMIETEKYGHYHATNEGTCSWYEFACEIFNQAGIKTQVIPIKSSEYPTKAKRPYNSRMSKEKLYQNGFEPLPTWQDALSRYLKEIGEVE